MDFAQFQEAASAINNWCSMITKDHIKKCVDDVAHSVIVLINTIYFNGHWSESFDESQTIAQKFWLDSKATSTAQFMTKTSNFYYADSVELNAKILRLPYKVIFLELVFIILLEKKHIFVNFIVPLKSFFSKGEKFAMYIVLPNKIDGLDELVSHINSSNIQRTSFLLTQIKVSLLKFKILNTIKLKEILESVNI